MLVDLITPRGEELRQDLQRIPWDVYPRPQMRRNNYVNLNGCWLFRTSTSPEVPATVPDPELPKYYSKGIRVPFCPESQLSDIKEHFSEGEYLFYYRQFDCPECAEGCRVLLHIGAADQIADIYVNQKHLFRHIGGYEAFTVDITDALLVRNELVIRCQDDLRDKTQPYGKQVMKRGGMWYTPVSGIWQTVWLECVPQNHIQKLHMENRGYSVKISVEPAMEGTVSIPELGDFPLVDGSVTVTPESPRLWSPESPNLYDFSVTCGEDRVESYFAIRSLETKTVDGIPRLCLNGKPYFFHGLLDQGYWPESLLTAPAPESYADDILTMKSLGFNTLRKHIKIEPEEFYYQCDKLGMVVFQDMVNNGKYSFFRDTALPTVGIQKWNDRLLHRNKESRREFLRQMEAAVNQLKNHPSICYWTIFNEGWGQFDSDNVYEQFKKLDDTRFIDTTSGWFRRKKTDVDSRHVYFKPVRLKAADKPLVLSEFGGYSFKPEGHVFNTDQTYGYGKFEDLKEFEAAVEKLYFAEILPAFANGLCAAIYTQVSDIEDETNGLWSYDRKVLKLTPEKMQSIAQLFR